jgi:hypothetical protein
MYSSSAVGVPGVDVPAVGEAITAGTVAVGGGAAVAVGRGVGVGVPESQSDNTSARLTNTSRAQKKRFIYSSPSCSKTRQKLVCKSIDKQQYIHYTNTTSGRASDRKEQKL